MSSSAAIRATEGSINGFMAEVATNDKFSGLYIGTYGVGGQQHEQQQHGQQQQHEQQHGQHQHHQQQLQQQQQQQQMLLSTDEQQHVGQAAAAATDDELHCDLEAYVQYADSLAKCGRLCDSLDLYSRCFRVGPLPADFLWHVTTAFLELIRLQQLRFQQRDNEEDHHQQRVLHAYEQPQQPRFDCGVCDLVLRDPVTLHCGHTFCRRCTAGFGKPLVCHRCGVRTPFQPHVNVLVKSLVEKLWSVQLRASELLDEGKALFQQDKLHSALLKFNQAYYTGKVGQIFYVFILLCILSASWVYFCCTRGLD